MNHQKNNGETWGEGWKNKTMMVSNGLNRANGWSNMTGFVGENWKNKKTLDVSTWSFEHEEVFPILLLVEEGTIDFRKLS